jgi:hypothetical protein
MEKSPPSPEGSIVEPLLVPDRASAKEAVVERVEEPVPHRAALEEGSY